MAKLYNNKGKVHPSPPLSAADHLALLPAAILALAAALGPEDREVLAYLISCSDASGYSKFYVRRSENRTRNAHKNEESLQSYGESDHPPTFQCECFRCYTSFWSRWDASPNRQAIHEIIEAYEDELFRKKNKPGKKSLKGRRKRRVGGGRALDGGDETGTVGERSAPEAGEEIREAQICGDMEEATVFAREDRVEVGSEKGEGPSSVRKALSSIGERILGLWNRT